MPGPALARQSVLGEQIEKIFFFLKEEAGAGAPRGTAHRNLQLAS